jgi:hypothetical protein
MIIEKDVEGRCVAYFNVLRGADKSLAFLISPMCGLQHSQNNFSWMG